MGGIVTLWGYFVFEGGVMFSSAGDQLDEGIGRRGRLFATWRSVCEVAPVERFMVLSEAWVRKHSGPTESRFVVNVQTRVETTTRMYKLIEAPFRHLGTVALAEGSSGPMFHILCGSTRRPATAVEKAILAKARGA